MGGSGFIGSGRGPSSGERVEFGCVYAHTNPAVYYVFDLKSSTDRS